MSLARNCILSTISTARRFGEHAHLGGRSLQRACSTQQRNAACWRTLNYNVRMSHSAKIPWGTSKDESRELMALWPDIVRDITDSNQHLDIPDVTKWIGKVLQYNVPRGKKHRALALVYAYKMLAPKDRLTEEDIRLSQILGWCLELLQASLLIVDDIVDQSVTRRNQPCWYLHNNLGLAAINDGFLIQNIIYQVLQKHFKGKECYVDLLETFQTIALKTLMGQCLDLLSTNFGKGADLNLFTMDRLNSIIKYKTSYYSFIMPVALAMHLAGIKDAEMYRQAKTILLEMGHLFQVQDDYLDCYGDPEITGKIGSDIEEGKCTWLIVVALQRVTAAERQILEECYGSSDPAKVSEIKRIYNALGLKNIFAIYEEETYNLLNTHIQQISRGLPHNLFLKLLEKIYHRNE